MIELSAKGWWVLPASLLLACAPPDDSVIEASLSELGMPGLKVEAGLLSLTFHTVRGDIVRCLRFTRGTARLDGETLTQVEAGRYGDTGLRKDNNCFEPAWAFTGHPGEVVSDFEVSDSTGRLRLGANALSAPRTVTYDGPLPGPVPGGSMTLAWSPATDVFQVDWVDFDGAVGQGSFSVADERFTFTVPSSVLPGPHQVNARVLYHPSVAWCEPASAGCWINIPSSVVPGARPTVLRTVEVTVQSP